MKKLLMLVAVLVGFLTNLQAQDSLKLKGLERDVFIQNSNYRPLFDYTRLKNTSYAFYGASALSFLLIKKEPSLKYIGIATGVLGLILQIAADQKIAEFGKVQINSNGFTFKL